MLLLLINYSYKHITVAGTKVLILITRVSSERLTLERNKLAMTSRRTQSFSSNISTRKTILLVAVFIIMYSIYIYIMYIINNSQ